MTSRLLGLSSLLSERGIWNRLSQTPAIFLLGLLSSLGWGDQPSKKGLQSLRQPRAKAPDRCWGRRQSTTARSSEHCPALPERGHLQNYKTKMTVPEDLCWWLFFGIPVTVTSWSQEAQRPQMKTQLCCPSFSTDTYYMSSVKSNKDALPLTLLSEEQTKNPPTAPEAATVTGPTHS